MFSYIRFPWIFETARRRPAAALALLALLILAAAAPRARAADSPWVYGIHWYGDSNLGDVEAMTGGKPIWVLETVNLYEGGWTLNDQQAKLQAVAAKGHTILIRVQPRWGYAIPAPADREQYLNDLAAAAAQAANYCHIWQIGNEMNLYDEYGGAANGPNGGVLTAADYIGFYKQARQRIRAAASPLGEQIVLVGPVSPGAYYGEVRHTAGLEYLSQMCDGLTLSDTDGFAIHAYGAPWFDAAGARADFQNGYAEQLRLLDQKGFRVKPVYITEWNRQTNPPTDAGAEAQTAQFLYGAFTDLRDWNANPVNHPVVCATWFIYSYDPGAWANFSIRYLRDVNPRGAASDLFDAFQAAAALDIPAGGIAEDMPTPTPLPTPPPTAPAWDAALARHTLPATLAAGETRRVSITYQNTGRNTWTEATRLATSRGTTRSPFEHPSWAVFSADMNRAARLAANSAAYSQEGSFVFLINAPAAAGRYTQNFELVQEGVSWFNGTGDNYSWSVDVAAARRIEAEDYTGGESAQEGVDYHDLTSGNAGGKYRAHNVDIGQAGEGTYMVGWTDTGEWLRYAFTDGGTFRVTVRYAAPFATALRMLVNGSDFSGRVDLPSTGDWDFYETAEMGTFTVAPGDHTLRAVIESGGVNLNYYMLIRESAASPTPSPTGSSSATPSPSATASASATVSPTPAPSRALLGLDPNQPINPSTGAIQINAAQVAATGAEVVRLNMILSPWSSPGDTTLHSGRTFFQTYDQIVNDLMAQGLIVYALVGAESVANSTRERLNTDAYVTEYAANFEAIVGHFKDRVRHYESFNEPNDWAGGSSAQVEPAWFAKMLQEIYMEVKYRDGHWGDPSWQVTLVSGPLFTHDIGGGDTSGGDTGRAYFAATAQAGISQHDWTNVKNLTGSYPYDGVGMHIYVKQGETTAAPIQTRMNYNLNELWAGIAGVEGAQTPKRIWVSEVGWQSVNQITEAIQADNLETALNLLLADSRVALATWFSHKDFPGGSYGLLRSPAASDADRKPAWFRYKGIADALAPTQTPTPSPTASTSPSPSPTQQGLSGLRNGGFEEGFTAGGVGNYWTSWQSSWSNPITFWNEETLMRQGAAAQGWGSDGASRVHGGVYQRVAVTPGASYRLEAWMRRSSGASDMWLEFGYDLTGGVSPEAASVQYTKLEGLGANTWVPFAANLTATGDSLTLFAKGGHWEEDAQPNRFWVDDVTLTLATATPSPSASPSPTASAAPSPSPSPTSAPTASPSPTAAPTLTPGPSPTRIQVGGWVISRAQ